MLLRIILTSFYLITFTSFSYSKEAVPQAFIDTKIVEKLNQKAFTDLILYDSDGKKVDVDSFFNDKAVLFNFVYYSCPRLCHFVTSAMADSLSGLSKEYLDKLKIVTISFDHRDTVESAKNFQQRYQKSLESHLGFKLDWGFYIGDSKDVLLLANSLGYKYQFNDLSNQYAHSSALILCSPSKLISRYLYGIEYNPFNLKLSIIEALKNKSLSSLDSILLFCYNYDPLENTFILQSARLMKVGGAITVFIIIFVIIMLKMNERRNNDE